MVLLALAELKMCHADGVAGTGRATHVSRRWCCWHWQGYEYVTQVMLLAQAVVLPKQT
jgi:hypothetical protein